MSGVLRRSGPLPLPGVPLTVMPQALSRNPAAGSTGFPTRQWAIAATE